MAVRTSLIPIINRVRLNISDAAGSESLFTDEEIQEYLDARRRDVFELPLAVAPSDVDFYSPVGGWWEDSVTLTTTSEVEITALTTPALVSSNLVIGHWKLDDSLNSLLLTGSQYDVNGCSADLLDATLTRVMLEFDFLELGSTFKASQQAIAVEQAVKRYRARQWIVMSQFNSNDYNMGWYQ